MSDETKEEITLKNFLSSMKMDTEVENPTPMIKESLSDTTENVSNEDRFLSSLAAVLYNVDREEGRFDKGKIQDLIVNIDTIISDQLNEILHHEKIPTDGINLEIFTGSRNTYKF